MEYIYILDYSIGEIYKIEIESDELNKAMETYGDLSSFLLAQYGIHEDYCSWMVSTNNINKFSTLNEV